MKRSFFHLFNIFCLVSFLIFLNSCDNLFHESRTELTLILPAGQSALRAADTAEVDGTGDYSYKITFLHEGGTETLLAGKSGETISLSPALPGKYTISGQAYDADNNLCYEGSCTAIAESGLSTNVELTMKAVSKVPEAEPAKTEEEKTENSEEIISEADHIKLESDEKGIKITIQALESDLEWTWDNTYILEEESGNNVCINQLLSPGKSEVYYYPFTEKDKIYHFAFEVTTKGKGHITEKVNIKAVGGDASYFTYNSDYEDAQIILNDGKNGNLKLTKDYMSIFNTSKNFSILRYYIDNYGSDSNDKNDGWGKWINPVKIDYEDRADFVSSGINIWDVDSGIASEISQYKYWMTYVTIEFAIPQLPDQIFRTNNKISDFYEFEKPEEFRESKHMSVEPCPEGVKITLHWKEGDGDWEEWYNLKEKSSKAGFNFYPYPNAQLMPSSSKPDVEYIYPLTENGKVYTFVFASSAGGEYKEEHVWCKAAGGLGELIDFDKWNAIEPVLDAENYSFHINGDIPGLADPLNYTKFSNVYIEVQLQGGHSDFSDSQFIGAGQFYGSDILNNKLTSEISLDNLVPFASAKLVNWDVYFIQASLLYEIPDNPIVFTSTGITDEVVNSKKYSGEQYVEDFVSLAGDWNLYFVGYESDFNGITFGAEDLNACEFSIVKDFDNDLYEMQFVRKVSNMTAGKTYKVDFDFTANVDVDKFEFDFFANGGYCVDYHSFQKLEIQALANESLHISYDFICDVDANEEPDIVFIPFYAGSYKIENITIEEE